MPTLVLLNGAMNLLLLQNSCRGFVMLFYSFFKSLVGKDVVVELKNDLSICGTLHSVDQYLNIKLTDISVTDPDKYPHMLSVKNCFIRGSVVR
jgi:small nuclear ribonucleoprotein (snRNP)-like protein